MGGVQIAMFKVCLLDHELQAAETCLGFIKKFCRNKEQVRGLTMKLKCMKEIGKIARWFGVVLKGGRK